MDQSRNRDPHYNHTDTKKKRDFLGKFLFYKL